jgi:hypothetical protein
MRMALAVLAGAITLVASGVSQAQGPSGYEKEPVLNAKDLAGPELLTGPHFTVDPKVPVRGFIARFTIRSPFGKFEAYGLRMLPIRVNEVEAIAKLDELSRTREFTAALGRAAVRPVTAAANMVVRPVETITGLPGGVTRLFGRIGLAGRRIGEAAVAPGLSPAERTAEVSRRVGTTAITALGFEEERRRLAQRLGVDPYTTNPVLSERLSRVAWVAFSGRFGVTATTTILVPYSQAMSAVSVTNSAVWDTPASDLINNASAIFRRTGASGADVRALMQNQQYSLSVLTALATGIERLKGVEGRDAAVIFAAAAQTQDEVNFVAGAVNMLARYHEAVSPLARVSAPGPILGHTAAGGLFLPAPVDYVSWIEPLGRMVGRPEFQAPEKVAFLSGQMSPLARKNAAARGWRIEELFTIAAER